MTAITISKNAQAAIQIAQWVRNGKAPVAELQNKLSEMIGYAVYVRPKQIFHNFGGLTSAGASLIPDSLATRKRWRFAWHSGPYATFSYVQFEIAPENVGGPTDPYCVCDINVAGSATAGTATMHWGSSSGSYADVPVNFGGGTTFFNVPGTGSLYSLTPDTDYEGVFRDIGTARLHSATIWEVAISPNTTAGYPTTTRGSGSPIFDKDRTDDFAMARTQWARGATQLWNWNSNIDSEARAQSLAGVGGSLGVTLAALTLTATGTTVGADAFTVYPDGGAGTVQNGRHDTTVYVYAIPSSAQTNGQFAIRISPASDDGIAVVGGMATADAQGWTQVSAWAITTPAYPDPPYWSAMFTKASVPAVPHLLQFTLTSGDWHIPKSITMTTDFGTVSGVTGTGITPLTTQATSPDSTPVTITTY